MDKLLYLSAAIHIGFGFAHLSYAYFAAHVATYGGAYGFLQYTPLQKFVRIDAEKVRDISLLDFESLFNLANNLGDTITVLTVYNYDILTLVQPDDGFVYWVVLAFRIVTWAFNAKLGFELLKLLFQSGLLQSSMGLALVMGGVGLTALLAGYGAVR